MSKAKTKVNKSDVETFVRKSLHADISELKELNGGELSRAFRFKSGGEKYVIRVVNSNRSDYEKDKYAYKNFSSKNIPIPKIYKNGVFGDYNYAISALVKGKILENYSKEVTLRLIPSIIKVLDSIHSVGVQEAKGYGYWNKEGKGKYGSFKETILSYFENEINRWDDDYSNTVLERKVFDEVHKEVKKLIQYVSEDKKLVHADYGFENLIVDKKGVTGVIDWEQSMYGDFLYDIAWLTFWSTKIDYESSLWTIMMDRTYA